MSDYEPENVWEWAGEESSKFGSINRPTAGARVEQELPVGEHGLQLYSLGTPNGIKVTILLEELLELGISGAEYDAHLINILDGSQFTSGFVNINPNSKIPALYDTEAKARVFESGSILYYLANKFGHFIPENLKEKTEMMNWLFWQMGSAPYLGGGFGHFYNYAPIKIKYAIDRFSMEAKRQLDVLNQQLEKNEYIAGSEYTIADIAIWPWYGALVKGKLYDAEKFLSVSDYKHVIRWADLLLQRPAVKRGRLVNVVWAEENKQVPERHSKKDFDGVDLEF